MQKQSPDEFEDCSGSSKHQTAAEANRRIRGNSVDNSTDPPEWLGRLAPAAIQTENTTKICGSCHDTLLGFLPKGQTKTKICFKANQIFSCTLCNMLQALPVGSSPTQWYCLDIHQKPEQPHDTISAKILWVSRRFWEERDGEITIDLATGPPKKIRLHPQENACVIHPLSVNFRNLKEKLSYCLENHNSSCSRKGKSHVRGLRVIDCQTRAIETAEENTSYATLSYVWGASKVSAPEEEPLRNLPCTVGRTIEDALEVTLNMGLRYLWVDKYCLDQHSPETLLQIQQMDSIYQSSEFTIIAAAGEDATYGLPGVSTRPRAPMKNCRVGSFLILDQPILHDRKNHRCELGKQSTQSRLLLQSKWNTRAWTYQEALLSRRCLVFTDQEASFSCRGIALAEGSEIGSFPMSHLCKTIMPSFFDNEIVSCGIGRRPSDIGSRIREYAQRDLTFPGDILNGLAGILKAFEKTNPPVYHLWGVPVIPCSDGKDSSSLDGSSTDGFVRALGWTNLLPSTRRHGFPSWSWTGWNDLKTLRTPYWNLKDNWKDDMPVRVSVELKDGTVLSWAEVEARDYLKDEPHRISRTIWLDAWTMEGKFRRLWLPWYHSEPTYYATFVDDLGQECCVDFQGSKTLLGDLAENGESEGLAFTGVILGSLSWTTSTAIIIKFDALGESAERIGTFLPWCRRVLSSHSTERKPDDKLGTVTQVARRESTLRDLNLKLERRLIRLR